MRRWSAKTRSLWPYLAGALLILMASSGLAAASDTFSFPLGHAAEDSSAWDRFVDGWRGLLNWRTLVAQVVELVLAAALAWVISVHPRGRSFSPSLAFVDQHKTLPLYAVVATIISEIAQVYPAMAFVIFGIGGVMRFRTDLGLPKLTGRAILVVVIGLAVGLELFSLALLGTAFGWLLIYVLESKVTLRLRVTGLDVERVEEATRTWRQALEELDVEIVRILPYEARGEIDILLLVPHGIDGIGVRSQLRERIPAELHGRVDPKLT